MKPERFAASFEEIRPGMSDEEVKLRLGEPRRIAHEVWTWVDLEPDEIPVGGQSTLYQVRFKGKKVASTTRVPGISKSGKASGR